jgi:hypothetical protein
MSLVFLAVCQVAPALAQPSDVEALLRPSAKQKIDAAARELATRIFSSSTTVDLYSAGVSVVRGRFQNVSNLDVESAFCLVMLTLYESLQQDLEQQVSDIQKSNDAKRQWVSYNDALNSRLTFLQNTQKEASPSSRAPGSAASVARPMRTSPELTRTRRLGIRYAKVPPLPPQPNPRQLSASELREEIRTADAAIRLLDEVLRIDQRALDDASRKKQQVIETRDRLLAATRDKLRSVAQNLR